MSEKQKALDYHARPQPGKIAIVPTKPCETARDLSLAYSPGVAQPCLEIHDNREDVYKYTSKGNLVAVISNGTAVLGLGNIGPSASKPVMEGKGVLFKTFADIDVFDIELDAEDPQCFIQTVAAMSPTFGGINLEDIKAPECFVIEKALKDRLDIPVFHDDQHGTAIIAAAALKNALSITGREIEKTRLVINGAGAAAIACANLLLSMGLKRENLILCDSKGVIYKGREEGMNEYKQKFATKTKARNLADALKGADVFFGLSAKGALKPEMLKSMAKDRIVFAMANPDPEIEYDLAKSVCPDVIMATGRSDYPNQVNNVLGFPFIFRGALDVHARSINEEMKMAAVEALAELAREAVPESVYKAYGNQSFSFGPEYLIPKPFDPRVLYYVAPAVAKAAMQTGVARREIDLAEYGLKLKAKQHQGREVLARFYSIAKRSRHKRIAFAEGANIRAIKAAVMLVEENIAQPILVGKHKEIKKVASTNGVDISNLAVIEPDKDSRYQDYVEQFYQKRCRRGITITEAKRNMRWPNYFANSLLANAEVEGVICGIDRYYPEMVRPILNIVGVREGCKTVSGMYIVSVNDRLLFFADTTINIEMTSRKLASIAKMTAEFARSMNVDPRVAMLSFSNFGSVDHQQAQMVREAKALVEKEAADIEVDGEMQADTALVAEILSENYPNSLLSGPANVLIFPDMQAGNITYKVLQRLGNARIIGPIILGLKAPAYVVQRHASVDEIFNLATVAVAQATIQGRQSRKLKLVDSDRTKKRLEHTKS